MNHIIDSFKRSGETFLVSDIADEETELAGILLEFILHDKLFEFIAGINDDLLWIVMIQYILGKSFTEAAGTAGDQNGFII